MCVAPWEDFKILMGILFVCRNTMDHSEIRFLLGLPTWPKPWRIIILLLFRNESIGIGIDDDDSLVAVRAWGKRWVDIFFVCDECNHVELTSSYFFGTPVSVQFSTLARAADVTSQDEAVDMAAATGGWWGGGYWRRCELRLFLLRQRVYNPALKHDLRLRQQGICWRVGNWWRHKAKRKRAQWDK